MRDELRTQIQDTLQVKSKRKGSFAKDRSKPGNQLPTKAWQRLKSETKWLSKTNDQAVMTRKRQRSRPGNRLRSYTY